MKISRGPLSDPVPPSDSVPPSECLTSYFIIHNSFIDLPLGVVVSEVHYKTLYIEVVKLDCVDPVVLIPCKKILFMG